MRGFYCHFDGLWFPLLSVWWVMIFANGRLPRMFECLGTTAAQQRFTRRTSHFWPHLQSEEWGNVRAHEHWADFNTSSSVHWHHSHSFVLHVVKSKEMDAQRTQRHTFGQIPSLTWTPVPLPIGIISLVLFQNLRKWTIAESFEQRHLSFNFQFT